MKIRISLLFLCLGQFCITVNAQQPPKDWFEFTPNTPQPGSAINLTSWLDAPAGKHGFLTMKGKDYQFEDGTPVKFWGVNIAGEHPFMEKQEVAEWIKTLSAYGINGVRLHKFTWEAADTVYSTRITPNKWKRLDYFLSELKKSGIYYGWSHIYGHRVHAGDSSRLLAYNEIRDTKFRWSHLNGTTASLVNFAEDLQALNIELTVNMLNHFNPVNGLKYADDPALNFIELQNEDNIFWGAIEESLKQAPTYRSLLEKKFSRWLREKYGSQSRLEQAWQGKGLDNNANLDEEDIYPNPSHQYFTTEWTKAEKNGTAVPPHVADRAAFLFEEQSKFYSKFVKAIRETGYKGVIISSCWQAGSGVSHYYNLYSDYLTGAIDRHNYFGGGEGHSMHPGKFDNKSMIADPGSGLLSTGLQQVKDRPFQISEWMSLIPNEWTAESSPLIAVYGMGLQGWDASYAFAMDQPDFTPTIQRGTGIYNVNSPTQLALYPALSAMIMRGDLDEGGVVSERVINIKTIGSDKVPLTDRIVQDHDRKMLRSVLPNNMLALGRVVNSFTDTGASKIQVYDSAGVDTVIKSNTGQLQWHTGTDKYFTVNSPGTKAIAGFSGNNRIDVSEISIQTSNHFANIFVTSMNRNNDLMHAERILITTMARAANTGMKYNEAGNNLISTGRKPILLEPVAVSLSFPKRSDGKLYVLGHSGNRTGATVPLTGGKYRLDGKRYKTIYYELSFD